MENRYLCQFLEWAEGSQEQFETRVRPSWDLTVGNDEMEGFTECVALELEASFTGMGHITIIVIVIIIMSVATAPFSADRPFTLQSLQTGS